MRKFDCIDVGLVCLVFGEVFGFTSLPIGRGATIIRLFGVSIAAIAGTVSLIKSRRVPLPGSMGVLGLFIFLAMLSSLYSIQPAYTVVRATTFAVYYVFLLGLCSAFQWKPYGQVVGTLAYCFILVIFVNLIVFVIKPGFAWWGVSGRFQGLACHPNTLGTICLASYPLLMFLVHEKSKFTRCLAYFAFFAAFFLHVLSGSRSSFGFAVIALLMYLVFVSKRRLFWFPIIIFSSCLVLWAYFLSDNVAQFTKKVEDRASRGETSKSLSTFTGRAYLWEVAGRALLTRPLQGFGYDVEGEVLKVGDYHKQFEQFYWVENMGSTEGGGTGSLAMVSLHNGYLSVAVGTGIVGLLVWLCLLANPLFRWPLHGKNGQDYTAFNAAFFVLFVSGVGTNFFEYTINGGRGIFSVIYWIMWATLNGVSLDESRAEY